MPPARPAPAMPPAPVTPPAPGTPATPMEGAVAGLFADVLGLDQAGPDDNFFDIGGSSLQVMRLVDRIAAETGADVGVAAVFLHPTPRELAARIDAVRSGAGQAASAGPLIELSNGAGRRPLVLIHPVSGTVFGYTPLAAGLASAFGVHGLQAPGLSDRGVTPASLQDLVARYTGWIRSAWPDGPYRLGGWSMGGVIAFEVARRLEQAGAEVRLLALLDAPFTVPARGEADQAALARDFVADAWHSLGRDPTALPGHTAASVDRQLGWLAAQLAGGTEDAGELAVALRRRLDVFRAHQRMLDGYQPAGPAAAASTLIVSANASLNAPARDHWPRVLAGPLTTVRLDADHYSFLRPPLATQVAAMLLDLAAKDNHD
jgi:thioesterase domain-containing protein